MFIGNNRPSSHLWWKEILVKHRKVSKYYETECRFTTPTEKQYSSTEGEAVAVALDLNKAKKFVLGCQDLIVITDHKPLLSIFNNRDLGTIINPRNLKLKERTLQYIFAIQYCPGKLHKAADAISRNPPNAFGSSIFSAHRIMYPPPSESLHEADKIEATIETVYTVSLATINSTSSETPFSNKPVTMESLNNPSKADPEYQQLIKNYPSRVFQNTSAHPTWHSAVFGSQTTLFCLRWHCFYRSTPCNSQETQKYSMIQNNPERTRPSIGQG